MVTKIIDHDPSMNKIGDEPIANADNSALRFTKNVSKYFMDFLETDFHKRRIPKRHIRNTDTKGNQVGLPIKKYESARRLLFEKLSYEIKLTNNISFKLGKHKSLLSPAVKDFIEQQIQTISPELSEKIIDNIIEYIENTAKDFKKKPEEFLDHILLFINANLMENIVSPIIDTLIKSVGEKLPLAVETAIESKDEILNYLTGNLPDEMIPISNGYLIRNEIEPLKNYLNDVFSSQYIIEKLSSYFEEYATSDLYHELNTLIENKSLNENLEFYLNIGSIGFNNIRYPIFYIPLEYYFDGDSVVIQYDPRIYINRKSLEYINQETNNLTNKNNQLKSISDRILYLDEGSNFAEKVQPILSELSAKFQLSETLSLKGPGNQKLKSAHVSLDNDLQFGLFDKADESLINDYEIIINELNKGGSAHSDWLGDLLDGFIKKNPKSVTQAINNQWQGSKTCDKAVYASPIPLNEEQRKILNAIKKPDCKYIKVEGPPGTGKSHTITAIAFDVILNGQSILVLSDKSEALDVVEDKITSTLNKVRITEKFQNPILRLGRSANNYQSIFTKKSIDDIRSSLQAVKSREKEAKEYEIEVINSLKSKIDKSIDKYSEIEHREIHKHEYLEKTIFGGENNAANIRKYADETKLLIELLSVYDQFFNNTEQIYFQQTIKKSTLLLEDKALKLLSYAIIANNFQQKNNSVKWDLLTDINDSQLSILKNVLFEYDVLRDGFLGTFLKGSSIKKLNQVINSKLNVTNPTNLKRDYDLWLNFFNALTHYKTLLSDRNNDPDNIAALFKLSQSSPIDLDLTENLQEFINNPSIPRVSITQELQNAGIDFITRSWLNSNTREDIQSKIASIREYITLDNSICNKFSKIPFYDYKEITEAINEIETTKMTSIMDERVVDFYDNYKADAETLKKIIKSKKKFPQDKFKLLKNAFPCIIAGIRDYAEYIPLENELFDVVVIDEASQVSIAQALPALLRARTVVVLGDAQQFCNVKSSHASNKINNSYLSKIREDFISDYGTEVHLLERLKNFDIKTSVLEFFSYIANFEIMLKKHFRGYKELISFSSKYFYQGGLQSIKVRSRPIDETIIFTKLEHDDLLEIGDKNNTNHFETKYIIGELEKRVECGIKESIGIITPHTEQQKYITHKILQSKYRDQITDSLRAKVMTFDSCQGEERDFIYYSMVATSLQDRLAYIFPKELTFKEDLDPVRHQRLNVGFSRSKEAMHFILSKPIEDYKSSISQALRHYKNEIEYAKNRDRSGETDPKSPMEKKVYRWIIDTPFFQLHRDEIELIPQFPIGEYLKQLDQYYDHPNYRCDFLLIHNGENSEIQNLVIEYDGFNEHFKDKEYVNELNYEHYYNDSDIEREKVIESYGYKFIRINKFNLGRDPIQTLSDRIQYMLGPEPGISNQTPKLHKTISEIKNKDKRKCEKCGILQDKKEFYDKSLVSNYGRICNACKIAKQKRTSGSTWSIESEEQSYFENKPKCPHCSSTMVKRKGKKGAFWGCSRFPKCRGTRDIESL